MARTRAGVFVDTSAWVALAVRRDQTHDRAAAIWPALRAGRRELVTTELVIAETHNLLLRRAGRAAALAFIDRLLQRRHQRVIWADQDLLVGAAEQWLRGYPDKSFSLTDAVSFEVMDREAIQEAFAFDEDFARAGFTLL